MNKISLKNLSPKELESTISEIGEKPYRVTQIASWIYGKGVTEIDSMSDIPLSLREFLKQRFQVGYSISLVESRVSFDGTEKFLFSLEDQNRIESVLIPEEKRLTLCVSSQVGCAIGCTFCLTGRVGKIRNLRASEILDQFMFVSFLSQKKITNIVFMGMGEPLDNLDNVVRAIKVFTDPRFIGMSPRRITVSTSGIVPGIKRLSEEVSVNLSVSLNAPNDEIRDVLMPINRRYKISELIACVKEFPLPKGKILTFEYVLLKGVNDLPHHAHQLARLIREVRCKVNIIPFNPAPPLQYQSPDMERILEFQKILISYGINAKIRKSRGRDILGACGQLAASYPFKRYPKEVYPKEVALSRGVAR